MNDGVMLRWGAVFSTLLRTSLVVLLVSYFGMWWTMRVDIMKPQVPYTIRVNTFRRNDLLDMFLKHYDVCPAVEQIQVIWSDQESAPPVEDLTKDLAHRDRVVFEIHSENSLNNRFIPQEPINTELVLSIDDDLLVECNTLDDAARLWRSSPLSLVGFSPRIAQVDFTTSTTRYLRWQHTWWNGLYSIVLTKIAFLHRDYLKRFSDTVPQDVRRYVDEHRNCEDLAMAFVVANSPGSSGPVWVRGYVQEEASTGISSGISHFEQRSECLAMLSRSVPTPSKNVNKAKKGGEGVQDGDDVPASAIADTGGHFTENEWPWVLSMHKADTLGWNDLWKLGMWAGL